MAAKKYYTVEAKCETGWISFIKATAVTLTYAKGFVEGVNEFYPCPVLRIIDFNTKEIKEEFPANGEVKHNDR